MKIEFFPKCYQFGVKLTDPQSTAKVKLGEYAEAPRSICLSHVPSLELFLLHSLSFYAEVQCPVRTFQTVALGRIKRF